MCSRIVFAVCFFLFATLFQISQAAEPARPNILWLSTEDIGPQLGCYGFKGVATPNIDAFAKRSLTFDTAWSNYPVCAPARTTIITGMYATALGAGNMRCAAVKPAGLKLLPELMREAGYYCTNASKTDYNLLDVAGVWDESSGKAHWKNRPDGKPFFAVFNLTKTHESKIRKRPHEQQIDPATVSLLPYWPDMPEVRQDWAQYLDNIQTMDAWFGKHLQQLEDAGLAEDTIVIFWGDHGSGMPRHKRYAGDSGMRVPMIAHVPEKWKQLWSSEYKAGGRSDAPVGFVDLAPTVLKVAGAEIPQRMQGASFLGPEANKASYVFGVRNRMDERYDVSRSLTDGRYVYIRNFMPHLPHGQFVEYQQMTPTTAIWFDKFRKGELNDVQSAFWKPRAAEQLYDLQADPHETTNLAADSAFAGKVAEFRTALREKLLEIGDLDLVPESSLYEYEQRSGESRSTYTQQDGFGFESLLDAASGNRIEENLLSPRPEIRFWALVGLINDAQSPKADLQKTVQSMLEKDDSMAVQVKAAEYLLANNVAVKGSVDQLIRLSDVGNSNFYVACNALDCLDRYREKLTVEDIEKIKAVPSRVASIKKSGDNLEKMLRRFSD